MLKNSALVSEDTAGIIKSQSCKQVQNVQVLTDKSGLLYKLQTIHNKLTEQKASLNNSLFGFFRSAIQGKKALVSTLESATDELLSSNYKTQNAWENNIQKFQDLIIHLENQNDETVLEGSTSILLNELRSLFLPESKTESLIGPENTGGQ